MEWNMTAECISLVFLVIIWNYSRRSGLAPSLKNRLFQGCFVTTFGAMVCNILSTTMLLKPEFFPWILTEAVTLVYFAATPLMGMAYFFYTAATVYDKKQNPVRLLVLTSIPGGVYLLMVLLNPWLKWLFDIYPDGTYVQGSLIIVTYLIFYLYCLGALVLALLNFHQVEKKIRKILAVFPIVAFVVILIQQFFPTILLSGSAATSALLIIYLYLQNKQKSIDHLTNMLNRQEFLNYLEMGIKKNEKNGFAVIILSLRGFSQINDTFGQSCGDEFLKGISIFLHSICEPGCLFRYSGDEFAILETNVDREHLEGVVGKMQERMALPFEVREYQCMLSHVIGVVSYPGTAHNVQGLINGIEYALSKAKALNITEPYYCGPQMMEAVERRKQILSILREKVKDNALDVFYQPIMSTVTHRFELAESLLRIMESPIGPIYPSEFIPIAEESGLIAEMTYQVLDKVCKFVNRLLAEGIDLEGIHVNFSALQFNQLDLVEQVTKIIQKNGTPYSKIKIEITESVLAENAQAVTHFTEEMHRRGILLGLDDFGTGYSNMVSVMNTCLDTIKLDKSLIWSAMEQKRSAFMVKNITKTFQEMGQKVVAEGVETEEQGKFVEDCHIEYIQGYLYARPMPGDSLVEMLKSV